MNDSNILQNQDAESSQISGETDIGAVAEQFLEEYREGKKPSIDDYARRYPDVADDIRDLFPTLVALERESARDSLPNYSSCISSSGAEPARLKRLNNYCIRREIGRGGMGVVYEAWDEKLERLVALKVMKIFPGEEEETTKRFQREAKMAAQLHHTNIVPVYAFDRYENYFYYAMQLIEGDSLQTILRQKNKETSRVVHKRDANMLRTQWDCAQQNDLWSSVDSAKVVQPGVDELIQPTPLFDQTTREEYPKSIEKEDSSNQRPLLHTTDVAPSDEIEEKTIYISDSTRGTFLTRLLDKVNAIREKWEQRHKEKEELRALERQLAREPSKLALDYAPIASQEYYRRVAQICVQTARAIDYAHDRGVLHRDIKPSNLLLDKENDILWITDFGLAKDQNDVDLTRQGQLIGTLRYLAPESLEGKFSPLTDVYSLGLTLYEMLALTPAFGETTYSKLIAQVAEARPQRPRKINPRIPRDLETIVLKSIEHNETKRYRSAGALADDLQRFLDDRPIEARRIGPIELCWRWSRRHRALATLGALVVCLTITVGILLSVSCARIHFQSERAQKNLDLALNAFEELFTTLAPESSVRLNFLDDRSYATAIESDVEITAQDAKALEQMMAFYDRFVQQNANVSKLLRKSAQAYARIGFLASLLGKIDDKSFEKSFQLYNQCLDNTTDVASREDVALEMSGVAVALLEGDSPERLWDDAEVVKISEIALDALRSIPDATSFRKEERENMIARVQFARATYNMGNLRKRNQTLGFFGSQVPSLPNAQLRDSIEQDFNATGKRIDALLSSEKQLSLDKLHLVYKYHSRLALWRRREGRFEEAERELAKSRACIDELSRIAPTDSSTRLAKFEYSGIETLVIGAVSINGLPERADYYEKRFNAARQEALDSIDWLVANNPNSTVYATYQIFTYYHFAKCAANNKQLDDEERLNLIDRFLSVAEQKLEEFRLKKPDYNDSIKFIPLQTARAEVAVRKGDLDDAERRLRVLEEFLNKNAELEKKSETIRNLLKAELQRLRDALEQARDDNATERS